MEGTALIYVVFDMISDCTLLTPDEFDEIAEKAKVDPIQVVTEVKTNGRNAHWMIRYQESTNTFEIGRFNVRTQTMITPLFRWRRRLHGVYLECIESKKPRSIPCIYNCMIRTAWLEGESI